MKYSLNFFPECAECAVGQWGLSHQLVRINRVIWSIKLGEFAHLSDVCGGTTMWKTRIIPLKVNFINLEQVHFPPKVKLSHNHVLSFPLRDWLLTSTQMSLL